MQPSPGPAKPSTDSAIQEMPGSAEYSKYCCCIGEFFRPDRKIMAHLRWPFRACGYTNQAGPDGYPLFIWFFYWKKFQARCTNYTNKYHESRNRESKIHSTRGSKCPKKQYYHIISGWKTQTKNIIKIEASGNWNATVKRSGVLQFLLKSSKQGGTTLKPWWKMLGLPW